MTIGSLFDGAGTFPFAGILSGLKPVWASEIEPFPLQVTKQRLPKMEHLGDVTKVDGKEIEPVDVITFGSPGQDLSVAGKRAGLDGERSGLFLEAIRIIKEMRGKTNGRYPRYAVWENVPGAFSSNKGEDFRIVLEEFCKIKDGSTVIPRPTARGGSNGKWQTAGLIVGDEFSLAWRVLDAQFWGIPQRRRRIFLVADFRGRSAGEILFERKGLQRDFATCRETWNGIKAGTTFGSYATGKCFDGRGKGNGDIAPTLTGDHNNRVSDYSTIVVAGVDTYNQSVTGDKAKSLLAGHSDKDGVPCVAIHLLQDPISEENRTPCLSAGNSKTGQASLGVVYSIDRAAFNQGQNAQYNIGIDDKGIAHTLVAKGPGAVCYPVGIHGDKSGTLDASYWKGCGERNGVEREIVAMLSNTKLVVRRVTPTECARLQGMPDWWCEDIKHSDSAEYKMWGNGMALPCVMYIMQGIAAAFRKELLQRIGGAK